MAVFSVFYYAGKPEPEHQAISAPDAGPQYVLCARCGEPLSLPLKGFEDKVITDPCYCVGCRASATPEPERQLQLPIREE